VASGQAGQLHFVEGRLGVGTAQSPPVIRAAKAAVPPVDLVFLDAPPGNSCPVVETTRGTDLVLLVTEPTPFGLHDLQLALDLAKSLKLHCGVVINRALVGQPEARQLCQGAGIQVFSEIPDSMAVAEAYSEGHLAVEKVPGLRRTFAQMLLRVTSAVNADALPRAVQKNLEQWARPGGERPSPTSHPPKVPPPAVCYLALRNRRPNPSRHPANPSPGT
jgi:MinD superfamily P-loop ATPase